MSTPLERALAAARTALSDVDPQAEPHALVAQLNRVHAAVDQARIEAMSEAAISGISIRQLGALTDLSPNSIPPRLASSERLQPYLEDGRVTRDAIARARHDSSPMTFTRRRSTS